MLVHDAARRARIKAGTASAPFSFPKGEDRICRTGEAQEPKDAVLGGGLGVLIFKLWMNRENFIGRAG